MKIKYSLLALTMCLSSNQLLGNDIAFTGSTGILSTPNAYIAGEGEVSYQYNNYGETANKNQYDKTNNHVFTLGIHPNLEIGGRLTDYYNSANEFNPNGTRIGKFDLSANLKIGLPNLGYGLPDIAIGGIDIAGEAVNFSSQYVVASKKIGRGTYTVGYAQGDNPEFNGEFGNINYDLTTDLSLQAEYTSSKYHVGASYNFARVSRLPIALTAAIPIKRAAGENDDPMFGLSFSVPLNTTSKWKKKTLAKPTLTFTQTSHNPSLFIQKLVQYGLEDIRIGRDKSGGFVVAFDNHVYNHSYLDALGLVTGSAIQYLSAEKNVTIILTDNNLPKLAVKSSVDGLKQFFVKSSAQTKGNLLKQLKVWYPQKSYLYSNGIQWISASQKNKTRLNLILQPALKTTIGTEWGTGDYSLAARVDLDMPLWSGGNLHITADTPISNSNLFDEGSVFGTSKHEQGINQVLLQQTIKPSSQSTAMISVGRMNVQSEDYYTAQIEGGLASFSGNSFLYAKSAQFKSTDSSNDETKTTYLASLRQSLPHYGVSAELGYGKFFEGDEGAKIELTRHIGDTDLTAYVNYIDKQDISGGLQISFPLTPRRDYKRGAVVVRGNEHWSYSQGTTIKDPVVVGSNRIRTDMMLDPSPRRNLNKDYYESNKLTPAYLRTHIERLREAYINLK